MTPPPAKRAHVWDSPSAMAEVEAERPGRRGVLSAGARGRSMERVSVSGSRGRLGSLDWAGGSRHGERGLGTLWICHANRRRAQSLHCSLMLFLCLSFKLMCVCIYVYENISIELNIFF